MALNNEEAKLLAQLIIDLYQNEYIDNQGKFTEKAKVIQRKIRNSASGFVNFMPGSPNIKEMTSNLDAFINWARRGNVWLYVSGVNEESRWGWLYDIFYETDEKFVEMINLNRSIYKLPPAKTKSEMALAAQLLDDEIEYEI